MRMKVMTKTRISMDLQKEIQFLKPRLESKRKIAKHLGINVSRRPFTSCGFIY
jgi:hypothetical protein